MLVSLCVRKKSHTPIVHFLLQYLLRHAQQELLKGEFTEVVSCLYEIY